MAVGDVAWFFQQVSLQTQWQRQEQPGQGLLVPAVTCMVFPPLIQIVAELVENAP
jgi:hypothetical protein